MPATDLISVDFPAPLSPTSAITSPSRTSKSTSARAWTEPNDFEIPRSSRIGAAALMPGFLPQERGGGGIPGGTPPPERTLLLAVLLELADTDLVLLQEAVREEERVVLLRD